MSRKNNPHAFTKLQKVPIAGKRISERNKRAENTTYNRKKRDERCCECILITAPSFLGTIVGGCYAYSLQEDTINSKEI